MKIIALISGGKDSIFNILKCVEHGHTLVAVVNLYPADEGKEQDSYMYQSVATNVSLLIAEALEVPIFRRQITGKPVVQDLSYTGSEQDKINDEVEDLYLVLREAKALYPDLEGVSSGAIASTYQKLRVENVCERLGLTSIAYLWGRQQDELLQEMIRSGMHSILVKVASNGLSEKHLGRTIGENYEDFKKAKMDNIAGEGGEYETLTLDCPLYKKKRIQIVETEIVKHSEDAYAPVIYLVIKKAELVDKN